MILGVDTATATASAALVGQGRLILEEVEPSHTNRRSPPGVNHRANHAETLLPLIDTVLKKAGISLAEVSGFAVSIGPGSFTGLRIGLSTVKGLAYGWQIPVVGVPTLFAVAARVTDWNGLICPFLDARRKEVYVSLFRKKDERLERVTQDIVAPPGKVIDWIQSFGHGEPCLYIGDGISVYGDLIKATFNQRAVLTQGDSYPSTASAVARLGEKRLKNKEFDPLGLLVPLYLRPSEAELKRNEKGDKLRK